MTTGDWFDVILVSDFDYVTAISAIPETVWEQTLMNFNIILCKTQNQN